MSTIDLLRHGEVTDGHLCLGRDYEAPLNDQGWQQMRDLLPRHGTPPWRAIVSSPRRRCAGFAEELAARFQLPLDFDVRFCELGFGAWEGHPWTELYDRAGDTLLAFQQDPLHHPSPAPGGEPFHHFERRVEAAWNEWLANMGQQHWLLIGHAGPLRTILRGILGFPPDKLFSIRLPHANLTRIAYQAGFPQLIFHGASL